MTASILACFATSVGGVVAAGCLTPRGHLGYKDSWISFAIGALAGTALLEALPYAWEDLGSAHGALSLLLVGAVCCLALDRLFRCPATSRVHGAHCYAAHAHGGTPSTTPARMLLAGDFLHSIVDGSLIAAAFGTSPAIGLVATTAILLHEVPRKCATVLVLVHAGRSLRSALLLAALSGLGVIGGGMVASYSLATISHASPLLLAFAASMMLYVALAELLPTLRSADRAWITLRQAAFMVAGAMSVGGTHWVVGAAV